MRLSPLLKLVRRRGAGARVPAALVAALCAAAPCAWGQAPAPDAVAAHRTADRLQLDGRLDEPAWRLADSITAFTQQDPVEGAPSPERTVVRFVATDAGLWVGFEAYDRDPAGIRHAQLRRDADFDSDDRVGVVLDPQRDRRSGYAFIVNPNGALLDGELRGGRFEEDWNGVWDARSRITPDGWTAELFVPWQTLRYPAAGEAWGMNVARFIRASNTEVLWRGWRRQQGFTYLEAEGRLTGLGALPRRGLVELRPFVLATRDQTTRDYDSMPPLVTSRADAALHLGLDAKIAVAPTLTLDLTTHTDFAQVEADRQVVNLSRFPLFFPEKRPFFLESGGLFDFGQSGRTQLFYSRRVGLGASGAPVPIDAGARLTGRIGRERIGLLAVRTGGDEDALDVAARVRHDMFSRGYLGGIVTGRGGPGVAGTNRAGGLDFEFPLLLHDQNIVPAGFIAWTGDGAGGRTATAWRLFLDYPNDWSDDFLAVNYVDAGFDPALGFVRETGYWRHTGQFEISPRPHRLGIRRLQFKFIEWDVTRNLDGTLSHASYQTVPLAADFESGDGFEIQLERSSDVPPEDFELFPGHTIAAGRYDYSRAELSFESSDARAVRVGAQVSVGEFYTGRGTAFELSGEVRAAPHVITGVDYEQSTIRLGGSRFTARAARLRFDVAATPRLATTLFLQWDNESDRLTVNARLHWIPRPGSDAYLVWNSAWPTGLPGGVPWERPQRGALVGKLVWYLRA